MKFTAFRTLSMMLQLVLMLALGSFTTSLGVLLLQQECEALAASADVAQLLQLPPNCSRNTDVACGHDCGASIDLDADSGQLVLLDLSNNALSGPLPPQWSVLGALTKLKLRNNSFTGTVPSQWSMLSNIKSLSLSLNNLTRTIPSQWSTLAKIASLSLEKNGLGGPIPVQWSVLSNLVNVDLHENDLTGPIPVQWSMLSELSYVDVQKNKLTGTLPSQWSTLTAMQILVCTGNLLRGTVPTQWSSWNDSFWMALNENQLTGTVPTQWTTMSSLQYLQLNLNQLNGTLPAQYSVLTSLTSLHWYKNQLTGTLPVQWSTLSPFMMLLSGNHLSGPLPSQWSRMTNLQYLWFDNNRLTGTLPGQWSSFGVMGWMTLSSNRFIGTIPRTWTTLTSTCQLWLHNNSINGTLPQEFSELSKMEVLTLGSNRLQGTIPSTWSSWAGLKQVWFQNNSLHGTLPQQFSNWSNLEVMLAYNNRLTGLVQQQWPKLQILQLDNNAFTGTLPADWFTSKLDLQWFSASNNQFRGALPSLLGSKLKALDVQNNSFSGRMLELGNETVVLRIGMNNFSSSFPQLPPTLLFLDASQNSMAGSVPGLPVNLTYLSLEQNSLNKINTMGSSNLVYVSLAHNAFDQPLPNQWGTSLRFLNISNNSFSGPMPPDWSACDWAVLDTSSNRLGGTVPPKLNAVVLLASNNSLKGQLEASWLRDNSNVTVLDFRRNSLSGTLPNSWFDGNHNASSLQFLDLSNNSLTGGVPLAWVRIKSVRLLLGAELWLQRKQSSSWLVGGDGKWLKSVCTRKELFYGLRELDSQFISAATQTLVKDLQRSIQKSAQQTVLSLKAVDETEARLSAADGLYVDWSGNSANISLDALNLRKDNYRQILHDLCNNSYALPVVLTLWGLVLAAVAACLLAYVLLRRWVVLPAGRLERPGRVGRRVLAVYYSPRSKRMQAAVTVFHLFNVCTYWGDIISDVVVLRSVLGRNWPFGVLLGIFFAQYLYSACVLSYQRPHSTVHGGSTAQRMVFVPVMLVLLPLLDTLAFVNAAGFRTSGWVLRLLHLHLDMERYHEGRSLIETMFESVPSCLVQSVIFAIGNNPSRPLYVDSQVFLLSIIFSGLRTMGTVASLLWDGLFADEGLWQLCAALLLATQVWVQDGARAPSRQSTTPSLAMKALQMQMTKGQVGLLDEHSRGGAGGTSSAGDSAKEVAVAGLDQL